MNWEAFTLNLAIAILMSIIGVSLLCLIHWLNGGFVHKPFWYKKRGDKEDSSDAA